MPAQEVGEAYVAIRAVATQFREQATQEVNSALASVRERATVPIRAVVETSSANRVAQSFQPVIAGAQKMGGEVERGYGTVGTSSHHAYERVQISHDGIRAKFGETLRAASAMGGGIALAYGAFSQGRQAIQVANELAHATLLLATSTGLSAHQASAWVSIAQAQGVQSTTLQTSFSTLSRVTSGAADAFKKAGADAVSNLGKVHAEQIRVNADATAYTAAIAKYGQGSSEATSKLATLSSAQNTLQGYLAKTNASVTGNATAFAQLGITSQQLQQVQGNLPAELGLIADKFQEMGAGTDRSKIAQQLFGRSYAQLLPLLAQGSAGIQKNVDIATQYGATLSGPTLKGMEELRVEQQHLSLEMTGLRVRIATALEPALISVGQIAITAASQFGNILAGGIGLAKQAMDTFVQSPYGQGLSSIAGDAVRFATTVRTHFEHTLSRPLSFSHLFDNFVSDLEHWLPGAAKGFWEKLNADLFAPGQHINPVTVPVHVGLEKAGRGNQDLVGAGIFPGSGFQAQGAKLGETLVNGMITGLQKAFSGGDKLGKLVGRGITLAVDWVVNGGGAALIVSAGLNIVNAFLNVLTDPSFWFKNWKVILELAIALFPYDKLLVIPGKILVALGLEKVAARIGERLFGGLITNFRLIPTALGLAIEKLGRFIQDGIGATFRDFGGLTAKLGRAVADLFAHIGQLVADGLPRLVSAIFSDLSGKVDSGLEKLLGVFGGGMIARMYKIFVKFVANATLAGLMQELAVNMLHAFVDGFTGLNSWLNKQVSRLFHEFIHWIEGFLEMGSPSKVAIRWGEAIVMGFVNGLKSLPGRLFSLWMQALHVELNLAGDMADAARHIGSAILNGVVGIVRRVPGAVGGQIQRIGATIVGLGAWLLKEGHRIGSAILNGVISGIKSLPGAVGGAIKDQAQSALKDVAGWAGIGSPSARFRDEIGKPINDGIVKGLDPLRGDMTSAIVPVMNRILNVAQTQGKANGRSVGGGITSGIHAGLNPLQGQLSTAIVSAARGAIDSAKRALGISSPSSVFAEQIGKPLADGIVHGMGGLEQALADRIKKAAVAAQAAAQSFGGGGSTPSGSAATGANQALGQRMMLASGWPASQWGALQALWNRESGWNQFAKNASSGAYGIPQSLPASKMASAGADYLTNPATQIRWGLDYIRARYGSPGGAWAHELSAGWYHGGGVVPGLPTDNVPIIASGGEVVFTPDQMRMLSGRTVNIGRVEINNPSSGDAAAMEFLNGLARRVG